MNDAKYIISKLKDNYELLEISVKDEIYSGKLISKVEVINETIKIEMLGYEFYAPVSNIDFITLEKKS